MKRHRTLKGFGRELRKLINSPEVFSLLHDGDWGAGGCWTLAEALAEYLGPPAKLMAISEQREREFEADLYVPVSHVVVQYGDLFIDYNGAQTERELFRNMEKEDYSYPELSELTPETAKIAEFEFGVFCDLSVKKELLRHLRRRFG